MNSTCHVSASDLRNPSVVTGIELANVHERLDATPRACFANCSARPFLPSRSKRDEVRAVAFLDRDGVINVDRGYTYRIEDLVFTPTAIEGIKVFNDAGYRVFVVTNQSGVARGYYTLEHVERFHEAMRQQLRAHNAHIDCFYFCPFHPEASVAEYATDHEDRKPNPGMLESIPRMAHRYCRKRDDRGQGERPSGGGPSGCDRIACRAECLRSRIRGENIFG